MPVDEYSLDVPLRVAITSLIRSSPSYISGRRRIQRAFHAWYRANQHKFLLQLDFTRRSDHKISFGFVGIDRTIYACLRDRDLSVYVAAPQSKEIVDMLISLDVSPKRVPGGYICTSCDPDTRLTFPTREAVWIQDLFEPFLKWVNEHLAPATKLHMYFSEGSSRYATLIVEDGTETDQQETSDLAFRQLISGLISVNRDSNEAYR
jgi:hypothetical protein